MKVLTLGLMLLVSPPVLALGFLENLFVAESRALVEWDAADESSVSAIDHGAWQAFLDRYLDAADPSDVSRVRYASVTPADRARLAGYLEAMQALDPRRYARAEQMAFWINVYNAQTVVLVLDNPGVESIREIRSGLFSAGPWRRKVLRIQDRSLSLDDVEHGILRPLFGDPRIHFAVNCASIGCPNLAPRAFSGENLERQLALGARAYVNHPRGARFEGDTLVLSSIFDWYAEDFGSRQERLSTIAGYADPPLRESLRAHSGAIRYEYDWRLNRP